MTCNTPNVEGHFNKYSVDELMAKTCQPPAIPCLQNGTLFLFPNIIYFINVLGTYNTMHCRVYIKTESSRVTCSAKKNLREGTDSSWG